ncbi:MAG: carboxypeptidase-like regulatory domain-containing protein [Clostridiales bacterium]|jgi:hypothetical protein|nr:carboxypeptidase-like regulatory domain-containing protein [Clostridiales bacterium]
MKAKKIRLFLLLILAAAALSVIGCHGGKTPPDDTPTDGDEPVTVTVIGTVTADGVPLSGATAAFGSASATTDAEGGYTLSVTYSSGKLTFSAAGYFDFRYALKAADFVGGTQTVDAALQKSASISGVVTDHLGAPLSGVAVSSGNGTATTAADGSYTLWSITLADAEVTYQKDGYGTHKVTVLREWFTEAWHYDSAPVFIHRLATLRGKVVATFDEDMAVEGVLVECGSLSAITDADGNYVLEGIWAEARNFEVKFSKEGFDTQTAAVNLVAAAYDKTLNISL